MTLVFNKYDPHSLFSCRIQVVYDKGEIYSFSKHGRFCQEIKLNYSPYTNYFTRVFWNRSYHVYKVNSVISFQYWQQPLPPSWDFTEPGSALLQCFTPHPQCNTEDCNTSLQRALREMSYHCYLTHPGADANSNQLGSAEHIVLVLAYVSFVQHERTLLKSKYAILIPVL